MNMIEWVEDLDADAASRTGPKIAKLGELKALGMQVPRGFVVTTAAYDQAMSDPVLTSQIEDLLNQIDVDDQRGVRDIAGQLRDLISGKTLTPTLETAITEAYEKLCQACQNPNLLLAVRSSSTGEDAADASFAGQFDTYLGVQGVQDLLESVRSCWASLFTERAVTYRAMNNLSYRDCPMAVGVLELIEARASGVAFSVHPVTGKNDRVVIEGSWGWGEAVVQGVVTPDSVQVGKSDNRILDYVISDKAIMSSFDSDLGRVVEGPMPDELRTAKVLNDAEIRAIVGAVCEIEKYFGHSVDVEWVTSPAPDGEAAITIVQARPETVHGPSGVDAAPQWNPAQYAMQYAFGTPKS